MMVTEINQTDKSWGSDTYKGTDVPIIMNKV